MNYFQPYKKYYDALKDNKEIIAYSNNLSNKCFETLNKANLNISNVNNSKWNELSKSIFINELFSNLSNNLNDLNEQISNKLVNVCKLSINSLLPKIIEIKDKEQELENDINSLAVQENLYNTLSESDELNEYKNKLDSLKQNIEKKEKDLSILCQETNQILENILSLNNNLSVEEININNKLSIDEIINAFNTNPSLSNFTLGNYYKTDVEGEYRITFKYTENGTTLHGILLLPSGLDKNIDNIFTFYSGSGGLNIKDLDTTFGSTNPPYVMLAFGRNKKNGGMITGSDYTIQKKEQISAILSATNDLKSYIGSDNAKIHTIGHSNGAIELNQVIAENPDYFETATIINGRIKFANINKDIQNQIRLSNYENASTKINVFLSTKDNNVTPELQLSSYTKMVDVNIEYKTIPTNKLSNKILEFDQVVNGFPESMIKEYGNYESKKTGNKTQMSIYCLEGAKHSGFLPSCLSNQKFYDLIMNN